MDLEEIQKAVSGAISAAISRAVGQPWSTDVAGNSSQQSQSTIDTMDDDQMEPKVERKYVTIISNFV